MDILILMDEASFPGVRIRVRLVGAIAAKQTEIGLPVTQLQQITGLTAEKATVRKMKFE